MSDLKDTIDEVITAICDNYCKYPQIFKEGETAFEALCENCPLNRLEELKEGNHE